MSFFSAAAVAQGYATSRPYFHPVVIQKIRDVLGIRQNYTRALDVGCGAGLSTRALLALADKAVGVDASAAMIGSAIAHKDIRYYNYPAEDMPLDDVFELITLAGAINWVDRPRFFAQAKRLLLPEGYVVVYDNNILGSMKDQDGFSLWYKHDYLKRYPKPPRNESPLTAEEAAGYGFELVRSEEYSNEVAFTQDGFIEYLFTQSNITAALENGTQDKEDIRVWFKASLVPFFQAEERTLMFGGYIWYVKN